MKEFKDINIAVIGTSYVGFSIAMQLAFYDVQDKVYTRDIFRRD